MKRPWLGYATQLTEKRIEERMSSSPGKAKQGSAPRRLLFLLQQRCLGIVALLPLLLLATLNLIPLGTASAASGQLSFSNSIELTTLAPAGLSKVLLDTQGHFHLLYTTTSQQNINLRYQVVSSDSRSVSVLHRPITLASQADTITSPTLVLDSQGRLHAAWIETHNGTFIIRHALLEDPTAQGAISAPNIITLYQSSTSITSLSAGADAQGNTFYTWLDTDSGTSQLAMAELHAVQSPGQRIQLTRLTTDLTFPHLIVYPDSTLAVVFLQRSPQGGWDLLIAPFDTIGKSLHDPTVVAKQVHPGPRNQTGQDPSIFRFDPLGAALDTQSILHIAWGAILQLGYTAARLQPDHSFAVLPTLLSQNTYDYQQLCFSTGPNIRPQSTPASKASSLWLSWLDDSQSTAATALFPYIAQIGANETLLGAPTAVVGQDVSAAAPCPQQDTHGGLYLTWQQFDDNGNYALMMKTTTIPPSNPFWVQLGLNRNQPIQQVIFILLGSSLLAAFGMLTNFLAVPLALIVLQLGKRFHFPRLVSLLLSLALLLAVDIGFQFFMAANFQIARPPYAWAIIGGIVALGVVLFQWYRSRRYPPEVFGTLGQLLLSSYVGATILSIPLLYVFTHSSPG